MEDKMFELMTKMYGEFSKKFDSMEKGFTELKGEITELKGEVTGLKGEVTGLKGEVKGNSRAITILEDRLEDTRKTLFDGYQQNFEISKRLEDKIDEIVENLEYMDLKQRDTEKNLYKVQKQLKSAK